jgi:RND family efflux transporter MFP subunit
MPEDVSKLRIERSSLAPQVGRRKRRRGWMLLAVAAVAAAGWFVLRPRAIDVRSTSVVTTYASQQFVVLNATGYVVAQRKAAVSSKATGRLEWLGVVEGSTVKENQIIARLDSRDVAAARDSAVASVRVAQANVVSAQAELDNANRELKRSRDLVEKGFISISGLDAAQARQEKAQAGVASARSALAVADANERAATVNVEYTLIRAPFDGVILSKSANVGDIVTPFSSAADSKGAVVSMADMSTLEVEADVSESSLSKVKVGQPCEIVLDALPDARFRGEISRMVPTVDRAKATVMTKVRFIDRDPRILPEMSAKVSFLSREITRDQQQPLTAVSPDAIVERNGKSVVYALRDGKAVEVPVTRGPRIGDLVAVSGVKSGEKVVQKPDEKVTDGAATNVLAK